MIKLKSHSVYLDNLHPLIFAALPEIEIIFDRYDKDVIITSARDGNHSTHSLHYKGRAIDLRSKHLLKSEKVVILSELKQLLGPKWDVLLEDRDKPNEHFHLEADRICEC